MAYRQTNTKLKTYFKTDSNNKNIFRNSHLTLSWKALNAAIKDNQNNLDMSFVKFTELINGIMKSSKWIPRSKQWLSKLKTFSIKIQLKFINVPTNPKITSR